MIRVTVDLSPFGSPGFMRVLKELIADLLKHQTISRLLKGGDDELTFAPLKFPRVDGSQNRPLVGPGEGLRKHLATGWDSTGVYVKTEGPGAAVHQEGTVGASAPGIGAGKRPTIKPVYAKALFIPLTMKAAKMTRDERNAGGPGGPGIVEARERLKELKGRERKDARNKAAIEKAHAALREAIAARNAMGLIRGKDFVFASKVDIPPRPFLRISKGNAKDIAQVFAGGTPKGA